MKNPKFSEIIKIEKNNLSYKFNLRDKTTIENEIDNCEKFIDPSYDSIFKNIFGCSHKIEEIDEKERVLSLLNSLIFPNETEEKRFISVKTHYLESTKMRKDSLGSLKFDISFIATIEDKKKKKSISVDIEMQLGNDESIIRRLFKYGSSLFRDTDKNTIVLALINTKPTEDDFRSQTINLIGRLTGGVAKKLDLLEIIMINLKEEIDKIQNEQRVIVNDKELGEEGINWIKFLGIRHFEECYSNYYYFPKKMEFNSKGIESAYHIVKNVSDFELRELLNYESFAKGIISNCEKLAEERGKINGIIKGKEEGIKEGMAKGKEEGIKEGMIKGKEEGIKEGIEKGKKEGREDNTLNILINLFKKKDENIIFDNFIDTIHMEKSEFKIEEIRKKIKDKKSCDEFITLLSKKRKLI